MKWTVPNEWANENKRQKRQYVILFEHMSQGDDN